MAEQSTGSQMRITKDELELIRMTFKGNDSLLRLMRKVFLPELDASVPLGQSIDLWMTVKIDEMPIDQALINLKARNTVITHLEQQLLVLRSLAESQEDTPEEALAKMKKNSTK